MHQKKNEKMVAYNQPLGKEKNTFLAFYLLKKLIIKQETSPFTS